MSLSNRARVWGLFLFVITALQGMAAMAPLGNYTNDLTQLSSFSELSGTFNESFKVEELTYTLNWTANVNAAGKVTGKGTLEVNGKHDWYTVDLLADYSLTGTVSKSGAATRMSLNLKMTGKGQVSEHSATFKSTLALVGEVTVNGEERDFVGTCSGSTTAKGSWGSKTVKLPKTNVTLELPDTTSLNVVLSNLITDANGKVSGTGALLLLTKYNSKPVKREIACAVTGSYNPKSGVAALTLKGTKATNSVGANLKFTGIFLTGNTNDLHHFSGKMLGQTYEIKPPKISQQPAGISATVGSVATFKVTATGNGILEYQWLKNGEEIEGETSSTLTVSNVQLADNGGNYCAVVSNGGGVGKLASNVAVLKVK